jgi:glycosyltransferase involved in cell wall biosynthesis
MKVLLSAYACEPNRGSEPEVGWQRALHMRKWADEVWVLTRANNQQVIEADPLSADPGLHFIYYDLPSWALKLKKRQRWFLYVYCVLWQWGAYRLAARVHETEKFDRVYHVTFASMQFGSQMGRLGIPFIIGPVAGGERSPIRLRRRMQMRAKVSEMVRDLGILSQRYSPLTRPAFAAATRIFVTTPESLRLIPPKWRAKTSVQLAIAAQGNSIEHLQRQMPAIPRFLFAGRLLHWKGVHLAIRALAEARRTVPNATITLVGEGPAETWLRALAKQFGVADAVDFAGHLPRQEFVGLLLNFTALIFPSLHDSGGLVVLEAFEKGLPAICFDLGGPGILVNESCGIVVSTVDADEDEAVARLAKAIVALATMEPTEMQRLSSGAIARATELSWTALTATIANCVF